MLMNILVGIVALSMPDLFGSEFARLVKVTGYMSRFCHISADSNKNCYEKLLFMLLGRHGYVSYPSNVHSTGVIMGEL